MRAEEYVKSKHITANAEKINHRGPFKEFHYLIWSNYGPDKVRLGEGETKSKAWSDAKRNLQVKDWA